MSDGKAGDPCSICCVPSSPDCSNVVRVDAVVQGQVVDEDAGSGAQNNAGVVLC